MGFLFPPRSKTKSFLPLFLLFSICSYYEAVAVAAGEVDPDESLLLTPIIRTGDISRAQKLAQFESIEGLKVKGYSGFITVNEEFNTNLFFVFFPATKNTTYAPVILWNDGGPGSSLFLSLLHLNGPIKLNWDKKLELRSESQSWNSEYNVFYLDYPATVGYSYTENEDSGIPNSGRNSAPEMYQFLLQFFKLFPDLQENDFYNGGCSYGGTYSTSLAHYIHTENQDESRDPKDPKINLKGLILDSPWLNPYHQVEYGPYLHALGLISDKTRVVFEEKNKLMKDSIEKENFSEAVAIWFSQIGMDIPQSLGFQLGLYNAMANGDLLMAHNYTDLVTTISFRRDVHVGNRAFTMMSSEVMGRMKDQMMTSVAPLLEQLLQANYRVLAYAGNFDVITGPVGLYGVLSHLNWEDDANFLEAERKVWEVKGRVAGYVQSAGAGDKLTYVMIRNASHGCSIEQPDAVFSLLKAFTSGRSIVDKKVKELAKEQGPQSVKKDETKKEEL